MASRAERAAPYIERIDGSPSPSSMPQPTSTSLPLIDLGISLPRYTSKGHLSSIIQPLPVPAQTHQMMIESPHHRPRHHHHHPDDRPASHYQLNKADIDRFVKLFSPASLPRHPQRSSVNEHSICNDDSPYAHRGFPSYYCHRESGTSDGGFGPFASVPRIKTHCPVWRWMLLL